MKKDIEWLKNEMRIRGRFPAENEYVVEQYRQIMELINQLDEPELTQEQVDKYLYERNFVAVDAMMVHQTGMQNKVVVEKPIIPKFVAEWIDTHNLYGNNPLREYRDLEIDFNEGWTDEKDAEVYHWVNKNPYAFIDALRYGYEVEKEQKYHVVNKENYFMLRKYDGLVDVLRVSSSMSRDEYGKDTSFMLTEKEIKDYDERYWAFAEEVTE